ncbi:MAG: OmpH family outer membrane protein [Treponema sp.]|jgi:outer membrane protein|nr:OmpH family outer membrane protein [Treponema sp.]
MNRLKKVVFGGILFCLCSLGIFSQQITKFAVVDTSRVYTAYYRNTAPIRNYESKRADFQKEIDKQTDELKKMQTQKLEYEKNGNTAASLRLEDEIRKKTEFVTEYSNAKNIELETLRTNLQSSDAFYQKLYDTLAKIAESEGYSMILSLQQNNGILWYSPAVDITDMVITALGL